jgi:hypothetical protein
MKKSIITLLATYLFAQLSFAQGIENTTTANTSEITTEKTKGIEVGLIYSNLTDVNAKIEGTVYSNFGTAYKVESESKGGTQLGIMGLNVNYKDRYAQELLGFYFGGAFMKRMNSSESAEDLNFYKGQVGLMITPLDYLSINGDINMSYISFKNTDNVEYLPAAGVDLMVEMFAKNTSLQLGFQALGLNGKSKNSKDDLKITGFVSGVVAQVSYMF